MHILMALPFRNISAIHYQSEMCNQLIKPKKSFKFAIYQIHPTCCSNYLNA
uniref:Uncharacterized protein n=1 Tax=Parascaris univalens TaxID=6257 RepID=A0A915CK18_PARUN